MLWTSEVPDFYQLKAQGMLLPYIPTEVKAILNPLPEYDGSSTAVRLGTLGIAYNTRIIKEAPKTWTDLQKPAFKGAYGIANPALSGTAYMSVAVLSQGFRLGLLRRSACQRAKMGKGSGQVVDDTASGDLVASLAVDYITLDKVDKGATLALVHPPGRWSSRDNFFRSLCEIPISIFIAFASFLGLAIIDILLVKL